MALANEPLRQKLLNHPGRFGFAQWVRLWLRSSVHLGKGRRWEDLASLLEIRPTGSLRFAASDLERCEVDAAGRARLWVNFMGLRGPNSPLSPQMLDGLERGRETHAVLESFLDIFDGRLYALYAQALLHRHLGPRTEMHDPLPRQLESLQGPGGISRKRLEQILMRELELSRVEVSDRGIEWLCVPTAHLGNIALGGTAVLGSHVAIGGNRLEIRLGPVDSCQGQQIARNREGFAARLADVLSKHLDMPRPWRAELQLPASLDLLDGNCLNISTPPRLGRTAWLGRLGISPITMVFAG